MKKQINIEARTVTFTFEDGLAPITLGLDQVPESVVLHATLHGLSQKVGDAAAIQKSEENGFTVTEAMRQSAVTAMIDQLVGGDWNAKGTRAPKQHPSILKLAAKWGVSYEEAERKIAALDDI